MKKDCIVVTGETVQELNEEISSLEEDGYETVGQHNVVIIKSETSMGGMTTRNTLEYSMTMCKLEK